MKLTSASSSGNSSPMKPKLKIGKAKSMQDTRELMQLSPRGLKSIQSMAQPPLPQVTEELEYVGMFVDEIAMDPTLLLRLVDYQELLPSLLEENTQIKQKILQGTVFLEKLKKNILQITGQQESATLNVIKKQEAEISTQIKKYLQLILTERSLRLQRSQEKKAKQKKLQEQIKATKENYKIHQEKVLSEIKKHQATKIELNNKIKQLQSKNRDLKTKFETNKAKAQTNLQINCEIVALRQTVSNLKKKQSEELENYKNVMMKKKINQAELKKDSQKKLSKFVNELTKIVENLDRKAFNNLVSKYEDRKQDIRDKNFSSDTKPDQNEEDQNSLQSMELKDPLLKDYKSMNLRNLNELVVKTTSQAKERNEQLQQQDKKSQLVIQQKMKNLSNEENDVNSFLEALREKIGKINDQLASDKKSNKLR